MKSQLAKICPLLSFALIVLLYILENANPW